MISDDIGYYRSISNYNININININFNVNLSININSNYKINLKFNLSIMVEEGKEKPPPELVPPKAAIPINDSGILPQKVSLCNDKSTN